MKKRKFDMKAGESLQICLYLFLSDTEFKQLVEQTKLITGVKM